MVSKRFAAMEYEKLQEGKCSVVYGPDNEPYLLLKKDGNIFAIQGTCPHEGGPLEEGEIEGSVVTCPWHGWAFELTTGESVNIPFAESIQIKTDVIDNTVYLSIQ